jgi:hypothetical protein
MDQAALKALKAFGVEPGKQYDANSVPKIDSKQLAAVAEETAKQQLGIWGLPASPEQFRCSRNRAI